MPSKTATISVKWEKYGLSTSLDVEGPDVPSYFEVYCEEIDDDQSGWIKSPYDTYSHSKWFTLKIRSDVSDKTLKKAIQDGEIIPTEADTLAYMVYLNITDDGFTVSFQVSSAAELDEWYADFIDYTELTFTWNRYNLTAKYRFQIPPFGSNMVFQMEKPTIDNYYQDKGNTLAVFNGSFSESYVSIWRNNGSLVFNPEIRHATYRSAASTYKTCVLDPSTSWNDSSARGSDYASISSDFSTITFTKMIYYDGAIALRFTWIDSNEEACEPSVFMVRDENGYDYSISTIISQAANSQLYYAPGYFTQSSSSYPNPSQATMTVTSSPSTVTNTSSGYNFNAYSGSTTSTQWPTCFLFLAFSSKNYAQTFIQMVRSQLIQVYATSVGSSANMTSYYYEIEVNLTTGSYDQLQIPTGSSTTRSSMINFSGFSALNTATSIQSEPASYSSRYYVPLFKDNDYDVPGASSISQGVRIIYKAYNSSSTTQHTAPAYFYPTSIDAWYRVLLPLY